MGFEQYLKITAQSIDQEVERVLAEFLNKVKRTNIKLVPFALGLINSCKGGKRIRGTLVKLGYELGKIHLRGEKNALHLGGEIIKVGAALEILHSAILIHDDVVDQSPNRRGQPTLYRALGGDHYGVSQAISLGDIGLYLPIKIISDSNFDNNLKIKAINHLSQTIIDTGWGEILDVELPHLGGERLEEDVILVHKLKTANYTVSGPLIVGAILAGGEEGLIRVLGEFGENLGIVFQIQDDILGVFGSEKQIGKSVTSDIEEGKNTLLISYALKKANREQRQVLDKFYGQGVQGVGGLEQIRQVFLETGALDYSKDRAEEYVNRAKNIIPRLTKDERSSRAPRTKKMSTLLEQMAEYLVERKK